MEQIGWIGSGVIIGVLVCLIWMIVCGGSRD